jgi:hypothetical protein
MFRVVLLILGVLLMASGLVAGFPAIPAMVFGALMIFGLLFERYVYKPIRPEPPGPEWERTGERFVDPESGRNVSVYFNPRTGERHYAGDRNDQSAIASGRPQPEA